MVAELRRMAHGAVPVNRVVVASTDARALDVASLDEIGEDALRRSLCDADDLCDVAQADVGVLGQAEQHLGVVRDERPGLVLCLARHALLFSRIDKQY